MKSSSLLYFKGSEQVKCSYSQLSSCIIHVCTSMGKFLRSIGQESVNVSLKEFKLAIIKEIDAMIMLYC